MEELEEFLKFVFENLKDPRVEFYKKMKYGYRHYFINVTLSIQKMNKEIESQRLYKL